MTHSVRVVMCTHHLARDNTYLKQCYWLKMLILKSSTPLLYWLSSNYIVQYYVKFKLIFNKSILLQVCRFFFIASFSTENPKRKIVLTFCEPVITARKIINMMFSELLKPVLNLLKIPIEKIWQKFMNSNFENTIKARKISGGWARKKEKRFTLSKIYFSEVVESITWIVYHEFGLFT